MNLKETVSLLSAELNIPAKNVRVVARGLLDKLAEAIESGEGFRSSIIDMKVRDLPEKSRTKADGTTQRIPARRVGMLSLSKKRAAGDSQSVED